MDEIVSVEELTVGNETGRILGICFNTEITDQSGDADYAAETVEENEHSEVGLTATEAELHEHEIEYADVDVDPIKMEVDMDEIVSAEELTKLNEELQVVETKTVNKDSVFYDELNAEITGVEENMEGEAEEVNSQDYNAVQDYSEESAETVGDSIFKEDLCTETELEEEISKISEEHGDSLHSGEPHKDEIPAVGIDVQTNDEQVIQYNFWENEETDSAEESGEAIVACEGEISEYDDETQIQDFTAENTDSSSGSSISELNKQLMYHTYDAGEVEIDNGEAALTKGENNVKISENTEAINQSKQKSGKNHVFLSKTHQNSEKHNSLKDVKIDLELKTENEASVINTDSSSRSSISELKKELMSLSELIKTTPAKIKSSTEVQNL